MPLALKIDVVTDNFDGMLRDIQALDPAIEFRTIVVQMALRVIQGAANRTAAATVGSIQKSVDLYYATREFMTVEGKKYLIAGTGSQGHRNRYPDWLWGGLQALKAENKAKTLATRTAERGLAKQSWLYLAQKLGGTIDLPAYATMANYKGKTYPGDVSTQETFATGKYGLTIINDSEICKVAGGWAALLGAMQGEVGYFHQNMAHGMAQSLAARAAKYPGIFVKQT